MATHDYVISNQSFPSTRTDINNVLQAIVSNNSNATAPSTTFASMLWYDTANDKFFVRNSDNDAWIELFKLDETGDHLATIGDTITLDGTGNMSLAGDLTIDTDTLFVDASTGNVGIGTNSIHDFGVNNNSLQINGVKGGSVQFSRGTNGATEQWAIRTSDDEALRFESGSNYATERLRIDSGGNLLINKTTGDFGVTTGLEFLAGSDNILYATSDDQVPCIFRRNTSDGTIIMLRKDGTTVGSIANNSTNLKVDGVGALELSENGTTRVYVDSGGFFPFLDNTYDIGSGGLRFDDIFATNGTIQTSDQNEKQQIASLTDAEITAAKAISKLFKTFKWNDAVAAKGDNARTHAGVIAQEVRTALEAEGLDAGNYAFFMSNTWWETQTDVPAVEAVEAQDAVLDDDGNIVTEAVEAVEAQDAYTRTDIYDTAEEAPEGATERTRLGIRYPELLAFVGAATEQRLTSIEARLTALEA